jgi:hypothetical protein
LHEITLTAGANTINVSAPDATGVFGVAGTDLAAGGNTINVSAPTVPAVHLTIPVGGQTVNISAPTATLKVGIENRKNLVLWSEDFSQETWEKNNNGGFTGADLTYNAAVAPDGNTTATFMKEDDTGLFHNIMLLDGVNFAHDRTYVNCSVHCKPSTLQYIYISMYDFSSGSNNRNFIFQGFRLNGAGSLIDAETGLGVNAYYNDVAQNGAPHQATIEALPNGWYRISAAGFLEKPDTGGFVLEIGLGKPPVGVPGSMDAEQYFDWLGDDTSGLYIWGVQIEEFMNKSQYTKTQSTQVTNDVLTFGPTVINVSAPDATLYQNTVAGGNTINVSAPDVTVVHAVTLAAGDQTINISAPDATGVFSGGGGQTLSAGDQTINISAPDVTVHLVIPAGGNTINISAPAQSLIVEVTLQAGQNTINVSAPAQGQLVQITLAAGANTVNVSAPEETLLAETTLAAGANTINVSAPEQTMHLLIPAGLVQISISAPDADIVAEGGPITRQAGANTINVSAPEVTVHLVIPAGLNQINVSAPEETLVLEATLAAGANIVNISAPDATGIFGAGETELAAGGNTVNLSAPAVTMHLLIPAGGIVVSVSAPDAILRSTFDTEVEAGGVTITIYAPIITLKQTFPGAITRQAHDAWVAHLIADAAELARETNHEARSARNVEDTQVVITT